MRPTCPAGHCCGTASDKTSGDAVSAGLGALGGLVGVNLGPKGDEICHTSTSSLVERTIDGSKKEQNFKCIQGATQVAATVLSVAAATFMMA